MTIWPVDRLCPCADILHPVQMLTRHGLQTQPEARGDGRRAAAAAGTGDHDIGRAQRTREIMGGKTDTLFQSRQPQFLPDTRGEPWIGRGQTRPCPFVEARKDHQVGLLQPRFQQAVNGDARMPALRWPHRLRLQQAAEQIGQRRCLHPLRASRRGAFHLGKEVGERAPLMPRPDLIAGHYSRDIAQ
ncbi:MAG: hypothetical protein B7Z20_04590, partial [Sphingobium sp. 32-64-5]